MEQMGNFAFPLKFAISSEERLQIVSDMILKQGARLGSLCLGL